MTVNNPKFETALKAFVKASNLSLKAAGECSVLALEHFKAHNCPSLLQRFLEAMPANYARRNAFIIWVRDHSPVTMTKGEFAKDKSANATAWNMDGAKAKHFWDYARPEPQITEFKSEDVLKAVKATLKRYENATKYAPATKTASETVKKLKAAVAALAA